MAKKNPPITQKNHIKKNTPLKHEGHRHAKINMKGTPKKHEGHTKWNKYTTMRISYDKQRKKNETHTKNNKKVCVETRYTH